MSWERQCSSGAYRGSVLLPGRGLNSPVQCRSLPKPKNRLQIPPAASAALPQTTRSKIVAALCAVAIVEAVVTAPPRALCCSGSSFCGGAVRRLLRSRPMAEPRCLACLTVLRRLATLSHPAPFIPAAASRASRYSPPEIIAPTVAYDPAFMILSSSKFMIRRSGKEALPSPPSLRSSPPTCA